MKVYEAIARAIVDEGVGAVFGLLGDTNMDVLGSLHRDGFDRIHQVRHESAAMAEADGYARASGQVAVCAVTAGPGFANIVSSLTGATRAGAPVVVLTGQHSRDDLTNIQWFDHEGLTRLTGAGYRPISSAGGALEAVRLAFYEAAATRRPVVLDVAADVQALEYPWEYDYQPSTSDLPTPQRPRPDLTVLEAAAELVASAARPVVIAGQGALRSGARDAVLELAEHAGALLATTLLVRGYFDGDPFDLGVAGLFSTRIATELLGEADCVIAVGASMNHFTTENGYLFPAARVVQIDLRPELLMGSGRRADVLVVADARAGVEALVEALRARGVHRTGYRTSENADRIAAAGIDDVPIPVEPGLADPRRVCEELDRALPPDAGLVVGAAHFWAFPIMHMRRRREPQLFTFQFGCIGQALPVALGAALALEGRPVVVVEGDGSLMMGLGELETLAVRRPRVLAVVLDDRALGAEYHKLRARGFDPNLGVTPATDLARLAETFGCPAVTVRDASEIKAVVADFLASDGPMLVDCRTSREVLSAPFRRVHFGLE